MYLQFDLVLSDVCAFLVDGDYRWSQTASQGSASSVRSEGVSFLPVIDRCGVILTFQQVKKSAHFTLNWTSYVYAWERDSMELQIGTNNFWYLDSIREPIISFYKTFCTGAIIRVPLFSCSVSSIDASGKDLSGGR